MGFQLLNYPHHIDTCESLTSANIYKSLLVFFSVFAGTFIENINIKPHEHFGMPTVVFFLSSYLMGTHGLSVKKKMRDKLHAAQQAQPLASGALALEH